MKTLTLFFTFALVGAALAGCSEPTTDTTPTPTQTTTTTPEATTTPEMTPTPATPTPEGPLMCDEPSATPEPIGELMGYPHLVVTVEEPSEGDPCFQFVAPATATAGWTAVTLRNNGMAPHIMPMIFIGEHTMEEALAALGAGENPEWAVPVGGVGIATPFQSGSAVVELQEGNYLMVCFFAGHHMQGMYRLLEVTAADEPSNLSAPEETLTISAVDYNFTLPENISAGSHVIKFVNEGSEPHEFPLVQLNEGTTLDEFLAAIEDPTPTGPPPGAGIGGVNMLAPGGEAYAIVDLAAGEYGFVCFVESPAHDGVPHVALGMAQQFTVG